MSAVKMNAAATGATHPPMGGMGTLRNEPLAASPQLQAASRNSPPVRFGSQGKGVAILQQVLMDLGIPLPLSTANGTKAPDGIYGVETAAAVALFQSSHGLPADSVAGAMTLTELDRVISTGWFGQRLDLLAGLAYDWEQVLRDGRLLFAFPEHASDFRAVSAMMNETLSRYGRKPRAGGSGIQPVGLILEQKIKPAANALVLELALLLFGAAALVLLTMQALPKPGALRLPRFPRLSDLMPRAGDAAENAAAGAAAVSVIVLAKAAIARADSLRDGLNRCLQEKKPNAPDCAEAVKRALELLATVKARASVLIQRKEANPRNPLITEKEAFEKIKKEMEEAVEAASKCLGCG